MLISITDIIKQSVTLIMQHKMFMFRYILLLLIPSVCSTMLLILFIIFIPEGWHIGNVGISYILYLLTTIGLSLVSFWFSMTLIRVLAKTYDGHVALSMVAELRNATPIVWPGIVVTILTGLVVFGGTLLLIIPGVIFAIWFTFAIYGVAIHNIRPMEAMKTSKAMVDGRWWKVFWRLIIPIVLFGITIAILLYLIEIPISYTLLRTDPESALFVTWSILSNIIISFATLLMVPFTAAVPIILYTDLKKHLKLADDSLLRE